MLARRLSAMVSAACPGHTGRAGARRIAGKKKGHPLALYDTLQPKNTPCESSGSPAPLVIALICCPTQFLHNTRPRLRCKPFQIRQL